MKLTEFLLSRIAEDEAAASAVPPLGHNVDMGGNRQDERFTFGRSLPSSADGMGNWSPHRDSPTTQAHFARHDPARVLAECEAKRRIVADHGPDGNGMKVNGDVCSEFEAWPCPTIQALTAVYADHPDYDEEWKP